MITIAACAPATQGFVDEAAVPATERVINGEETDPGCIREHVERMLAHHLGLLHSAAQHRPEVAVIPEDCLRLGALISRHGGEAFCREAIAEAYAGYLERIGEVCRQYGIYVVGGTATCRDERYYNTALMQDPEGRVIAAYGNTHLPRNGEYGVYTPGDSLPVFETALGKVGLLICWDIVFPETFATLALKGADIVFQPTFGHWEEWSDLTARSRCHDWGVPLVVSMWGGCACIVDGEGHIVAHTGHAPNTVAVARLELGAPRKFIYMEDMRREKARERRTELFS